jgi:RHS repeat-associated protein
MGNEDTYVNAILGRLTSVQAPTRPDAAYTWNATADRASVKTGSADPVTTGYTAAGRPFSDSAGNAYSFDREGRLTAAPGQKFKWDNLGRLIEVDQASNNFALAKYEYDPLDRLVREVAGSGATTVYLYVGLSNTVAQVRVSGGSVVGLTNHATDLAGTELFEWNPAAGPSSAVYLGTNAHGDVTFTADTTGAVVSTADYDAFGNLTSSSGTLPAARWQGSAYDAPSGLYYVIARFYSPSLGRFISVDPLSGSPGSPQSLDTYAYGSGDPVGKSDPSGRCTYGINNCWDLANGAVRDKAATPAKSTTSASRGIAAASCYTSRGSAGQCMGDEDAYANTLAATEVALQQAAQSQAEADQRAAYQQTAADKNAFGCGTGELKSIGVCGSMVAELNATTIDYMVKAANADIAPQR